MKKGSIARSAILLCHLAGVDDVEGDERGIVVARSRPEARHAVSGMASRAFTAGLRMASSN